MASHDAGGAAVLAAWLKANVDESILHDKVDFCLQGPAFRIYPSYIPIFNTVEKPSIEISNYDLVITSTSGTNADLERSLIFLAKQSGVKTIAMLDHWVNYLIRFYVSDRYVFPDEIWVVDQWAKELACAAFQNIPIIQQQNAYLHMQVMAIQAQQTMYLHHEKDVIHVLYLSEPSTDKRYTEHEILQSLIAHYGVNSSARSIKLRIRLHPKEAVGKYDSVLAESPGNIVIDAPGCLTELNEDIAWADEVVGCQTAAMAVALAANKPVLCALPASVEQCALPHQGIQRIFPSQ